MGRTCVVLDATRCTGSRVNLTLTPRKQGSDAPHPAGLRATMDTFVDMYHTLRDMRQRQMAHQVLNLAMIVCSALMIWKSLMVVTSSESPVVVVLSGSMEPAFHRGDILFLHMGFTPFRAGDIVVFKVADREIPIVHRVIKVHEKPDGRVDMLTKGDNNAVDDRGLYSASQKWINKEHVIGRAKGYLPYIGMVTIIMNDYPIVKYILVGLMGLFVLTTKE